MLQNIFRNIPTVTKNILIINVLMFVATFAMPMWGEWFACYYPTSPLFGPWQLITSMFMHGDLSHIAFNMIGVVFLGSHIERYFGSKRFLIYYIFTGLGALGLHFLVVYFELQSLSTGLTSLELETVQMWLDTQPEKVSYTSEAMITMVRTINTPIVGASGALFGILVAFGMKFPDTKLMLLFPPIPIKAKYFVIGYGLIELYLGYQNIRNGGGDSIAHFAHLGGLLFGFLLIKYWERNNNQFRMN